MVKHRDMAELLSPWRKQQLINYIALLQWNGDYCIVFKENDICERQIVRWRPKHLKYNYCFSTVIVYKVKISYRISTFLTKLRLSFVFAPTCGSYYNIQLLSNVEWPDHLRNPKCIVHKEQKTQHYLMVKLLLCVM